MDLHLLSLLFSSSVVLLQVQYAYLKYVWAVGRKDEALHKMSQLVHHLQQPQDLRLQVRAWTGRQQTTAVSQLSHSPGSLTQPSRTMSIYT